MPKNNPLSIDVRKYLSNSEIIVAPNPASKYINLLFTGNNLSATDINNIQIYDVTGNIVKNLTQQQNNSIYVGDLKSGFYILQITSVNKKPIIQKLIIEN